MPESFYFTGLESRSKLLVKCGFIKKERMEFYTRNEKTEFYEPVSGYELSSDDADEEMTETMREQHGKTGFPKPRKAYRLSLEMYDQSLEEPYYWILEELKQNYQIVEKLEDSFAAAENSAFFGVTQVRLGGQQDKVSQFLATTGKMIKELFQMVRELRIISERLDYYEESEKETLKPLSMRGKSAEITLKGLFIDLVQGGAKSAASVFGMSRELEFITLPDLFFDAPPLLNVDELETHIEGLKKDFNESVLRVLKRHLRQFMEWKKRTHEEHKSRRRFMLQYLLQHFEIIKMYINWVKPYLKHVARLTMKERNLQSADLISAFEGSLLDIEVLFRKRKPVGKSGANSCILATFTYRTRPEMKVVQEGYQRGPVHIGRFEFSFRVYTWTDGQVAKYRKLKEEENLDLMGNVSESVRTAMESLGKELDQYLEEARGEKDKKEEKKVEKKSFMEKFFGDFYTPKKNKAKSGGSSFDIDEKKAERELEEILGHSRFFAWNTYKNFKKSHKLVAW